MLELLPRFRRYLAAQNKAPKTIESYAEAVDQLHVFLTAQGMPTRVAAITREHVEAFIVDQLARLRPAESATPRSDSSSAGSPTTARSRRARWRR